MSFRFSAIATAAIAAVAVSQPAAASDEVFFKRIEGSWAGPGEIVAGKYKGTKFTCNLEGETPLKDAGMSLDGTCRVGVFTQKMSAKVARSGRTYKGMFLDGAKGEGLDVTSGNVDGDRVVFSLLRDKLNGAMLARMSGDQTMNVTISVRVDGKLVPVIGMTLNRVDPKSTASVNR